MEWALIAWRFGRPLLASTVALVRAHWREALFVLALLLVAMLWFSFRREHRARLAAETQLHALQTAEKKAGERARRVEVAQVQVSTQAGVAEAKAQAQIRTVYQTLTREVPTYVTPAADARCVVPSGLVRLLDAGAAGVRAVPDPAGQPDDAASGLALSGLAAGVLDNYGAAQANAEQLSALQAWIRDQTAAAATQ